MGYTYNEGGWQALSGDVTYVEGKVTRVCSRSLTCHNLRVFLLSHNLSTHFSTCCLLAVARDSRRIQHFLHRRLRVPWHQKGRGCWDYLVRQLCHWKTLCVQSCKCHSWHHGTILAPGATTSSWSSQPYKSPTALPTFSSCTAVRAAFKLLLLANAFSAKWRKAFFWGRLCSQHQNTRCGNLNALEHTCFPLHRRSLVG